MSTNMDLDMELDILGQQPLLNIYTQISWVYSVPDESAHQGIIQTLNDGLERLHNSFPWTAGHVVAEGVAEGQSGTRKIKALADPPRVIVKDLRHDSAVPTFAEMKQAGYPMSMLDEDTICPRKTIPLGNDPIGEVFMVQANFIKGGLILSFVGIHSAMDMTGQEQVIALFNKACRGEPFTAEELRIGNMERHNLFPLLDDSYAPGPEIANQINKPSGATPAAPPPCSWVYCLFPAPSFSTLKVTANDPKPRQPDGGVAVAMCLRDEVIRRLKEDEEFARLAKFIG